MLDRRQARLPRRWVTGDDEMGRSTDFRRALRERGEQHLLAVPSNTLIRDRAASGPTYCGNGRPPKQPHWQADRWQRVHSNEKWVRIDVGDGKKGRPVKQVRGNLALRFGAA